MGRLKPLTETLTNKHPMAGVEFRQMYICDRVSLVTRPKKIEGV
jgi:hypothetical protein